VVPWDQFAAFVESRHKSNPQLVLYADIDGQTGRMAGDRKTPAGLGPMEDPKVWSTMLRQKWADIEIKDAFATMDEVRLPDREMDKAFFSLS
jgi:hypothetical protein